MEIYTSIFERSGQNQIDLCKKGRADDDWEDYPYWDEAEFLETRRPNWSHLPKEIFTVFWQLELQDITVPFDAYAE